MGTGSTWKSATFDKDGKFYMNFSEEIGEHSSIDSLLRGNYGGVRRH